jgi:hypothetical protein
MKKILILFTIVIGLVGCVATDDHEGVAVIENTGENISTVVIDGCEYIKSPVYGGVYSHKGNCKNPIHYENRTK